MVQFHADVVARALSAVSGNGSQGSVVPLLAVRDAAVRHLGDLVSQIACVPVVPMETVPESKGLPEKCS